MAVIVVVVMMVVVAVIGAVLAGPLLSHGHLPSSSRSKDDRRCERSLLQLFVIATMPKEGGYDPK